MLKFTSICINSTMDAGIEELNIGGGLGISYTRKDKPPTIKEFADLVHNAGETACEPGMGWT
ncbi:MAG: hypothetical protein U5N58_03225 [Actinomycetota bacterium]|nr:hypothetical protein [Actinomycetota bacterium]